MKKSDFTPVEIERYSRHFLLPEIGAQGQLRIARGRVLVVGAGGLGAPVIQYLAAAGVGRIGIADNDRVALSNLQRQVLFETADVGRAKAKVARDRALAINPGIRVDVFRERIIADNARRVARKYDVIVDCSDNLETRYLLSDLCVILDKPLIHASVYRFEGQLAVFGGARGPCYRCLYPQPPSPALVPSCSEGGVVGALPGIVGAMQALEALKILAAIGEPLVGSTLLLDGLTLTSQRFALERRDDCPACANRGTLLLDDYESFCRTIEGDGSIPEPDAITPRRLQALIAESSRFVQLIDVRTPSEHALSNIGGVLVPLDDITSFAPGVESRETQFVVYCRTGRRSSLAATILSDRGFPRVLNLAGGLEAWRDEIDPDLKLY